MFLPHRSDLGEIKNGGFLEMNVETMHLLFLWVVPFMWMRFLDFLDEYEVFSRPTTASSLIETATPTLGAASETSHRNSRAGPSLRRARVGNVKTDWWILH